MSEQDNRPTIRAFPMHGLHKMVREGFRTRDAHFIEWLARLLNGATIEVYSRPEPLGRRLLWQQLLGRHPVPAGLSDRGQSVLRLPPLRNRRKWWTTSLQQYARISPLPGTALIWNPLTPYTAHASTLWRRSTHVHFDLLDNWLIHPAFDFMAEELATAYSALLARADTVTANSEATLELAHDYGRDDAVLLPNGCDPSRFTTASLASGRTTVGYVGKIGARIDVELVRDVCSALPDLKFVFAGPVLDRDYKSLLRSIPNVTLLGDVPYREVPQLMTSFDIGWVPHRVGPGEVGGDVIKIYEYRAAGLPVVTTPIIGTRERLLPHVVASPAENHAAELQRLVGSNGRAPRFGDPVPRQSTWEYKAELLLQLMKVA